jgi:hypothetical protein
MKGISCFKSGYASITWSKISNIPYNLIYKRKFNDSSILVTIVSWYYLNLSLANEYVGDVTIPTQLIKDNNFFPGGSGNQIAVFTSIKLYINIAYVLVAIYKHVYISRRGFFSIRQKQLYIQKRYDFPVNYINPDIILVIFTFNFTSVLSFSLELLKLRYQIYTLFT